MPRSAFRDRLRAGGRMSQTSRRPLKVGIELPVAQDKGRAGTPRWAEIRLMARRAEEVGFDSLWVEDHLIFRHAGEAPQGVWEAWTLLAAIAAATTRGARVRPGRPSSSARSASGCWG